MIIKLKNPTNKTINPRPRVNGRWFDGVPPGTLFETDDPYMVKALLKHGCVEVKDGVQKKGKEEGKKVLKKVAKPKVKGKARKSKPSFKRRSE